MNEASFLMDVLEIYSPTGKENKLASFLKKKLNDFGFYVEVDEAGNVIARGGKGSTHVFLCGHLDTVPGYISVREKGGKIYGRGASDAKGPLCALLFGSLPFIESDKLKITLGFVTREEGDSLGINTIINKKEDYDYAIFGEPSGASRIAIGYRGRVGFWLKVKTEGGHAGSPWAHVSSLDVAFNAIELIRSLERKYKRDERYNSLSVTPTIFRSGNYHNVIPSKASVYFDVRIPPYLSCKEIMMSINEIAGKINSEKVKTKIIFDEPTEPYEININSVLVRAFQRAVILSLNQKPVFVRKTGTGDMNTFATNTNTESVTYGPGRSELSHTDKEYIDVDDYLNSIKVISEALKQISALSKVQ
jgi:LysW-gamma-L-lysine carboxypeptidase